jgi:hypothetical protein
MTTRIEYDSSCFDLSDGVAMPLHVYLDIGVDLVTEFQLRMKAEAPSACSRTEPAASSAPLAVLRRKMKRLNSDLGGCSSDPDLGGCSSDPDSSDE